MHSWEKQTTSRGYRKSFVLHEQKFSSDAVIRFGTYTRQARNSLSRMLSAPEADDLASVRYPALVALIPG